MTIRNSKPLLFSGLVIAMLTTSFNSFASTLTVKNDDTANIDIIIEPGEGSLTSSSHQIKDTIKPKEQKKIEVYKNQLGDVEIFSVTGKVKIPSIYNRCGGLFIDKNYKIVFVGSKAGGTICYSEPN